MLLLRSLLLTFYVYLVMSVLGILTLPAVLIAGEKPAMWAARNWGRAAMFGARIICGIRYELRGWERLPPGKFIVASKHQASWETLYFTTLFPHPSIVFKKELLGFPLYGWYLVKSGQIAIDRESGVSSIKTLLREAEKRLAPGRPLIIFPEGTRQPPGAPPDYKPGIAALYAKLGVPCVPIALNSGVYWEGKGPLRRPGTIVVEILEAIPPGLPRAEFMATLETRIETATGRLLAEAGFKRPS